jgi:RNA polymerase sigma factor (sigma-70 family)
MYNDNIMLAGNYPLQMEQLCLLQPVELFRLCASDRENSAAWSEFLRRFATKLKYFIRGTLRQTCGSLADTNSAASLWGTQESDLFQNTILRLVENDCSAMKRFSGETEEELLAYLAVISRSVVRDTMRKSQAVKRRVGTATIEETDRSDVSHKKAIADTACEREILVRELVSLTRQTIKALSGETWARDRLVFELHFFHGLSFQQIAQCSGVNLSKGGVEKLLKRLVERVQALAESGRSEATLA